MTTTNPDTAHNLETQQEMAACAEYWVWLYAERRRRNGAEPTPEEKAAHPSLATLHAIREARGW